MSKRKFIAPSLNKIRLKDIAAIRMNYRNNQRAMRRELREVTKFRVESKKKIRAEKKRLELFKKPEEERAYVGVEDDFPILRKSQKFAGERDYTRVRI